MSATVQVAGRSTLARHALVAVILFIVYVSLYPWEGWRDQGLSPLAFLSAPWPRQLHWGDITLNVLAYVPLSFLIVIAMQPAGRWVGAIVAVTSAIVLSGLMEALQAFLPTRVSSRVDLLANATGALVGTGLGSALVPHLLSGARLRAWRARWFHHGSFADLGIVLLAVWPLTQAHPGGLFFGTGDLRVWLGLTSGGLYAPWSFTLVETLVTAANTLGLGLLAAALLVPGRPRWPLLSVLLGLAIAARVGVFALLYSPAESLRWVTPGSMLGLALGLAALAGLLRLWPSARIRWAIWLLLAALLMVNTSPLNPYLIDPASVRFQVHVLDFSGLVRALGLAWPFLALIYLGLLRRRPNSPL